MSKEKESYDRDYKDYLFDKKWKFNHYPETRCLMCNDNIEEEEDYCDDCKLELEEKEES